MRSLVGFSLDLVLSCTEQHPLEFALAGSTGPTQLDANHSAQIQPITYSSPNNVITVADRITCAVYGRIIILEPPSNYNVSEFCLLELTSRRLKK